MYIDLLFALNFMMDAMVLWICAWILSDTSLPAILRRRPGFGPGSKNILLGALAGAAAGCALTVAARVYGFAFLEKGAGAVAAGIALCGGMTGIAFRPRTLRSFIRQLLTVYVAAFLLGGVLDFVQAHTGTGQYFAAVAASFLLIGFGQAVYVRVKERTADICRVNIQAGGEVIRLRGLLDTGNLLTVPGLGTPVSVVYAGALLDGLPPEQKDRYTYIREHHQIPAGGEKEWHLIPFHSVGCENGLLPVLAVPHMCVQTEQAERVIARAMVGICAHPLSASGRYEILLHPKIMNS